MAPCHPTALRGASLLLSGSHVAAESDAAAASRRDRRAGSMKLQAHGPSL